MTSCVTSSVSIEIGHQAGNTRREGLEARSAQTSEIPLSLLEKVPFERERAVDGLTRRRETAAGARCARHH
jgi:hypothetical protein